jgi:hypothetical protein
VDDVSGAVDDVTGVSTRHRVRVAVVLGIVAIGALIARWATLGWTTSIKLRTVQEPLSPHAPFRAAWWNGDGTRAIVVGDQGTVFERTTPLGEAGNVSWRSLTTESGETLNAVTGGDGPWRGLPYGRQFVFPPRLSGGPPSALRVFAVGERGAIVDCTGDACTAVCSGTEYTLRAIAVNGGQALVVGDSGTLLQLVPDPTHDETVPRDRVVVRTLHLAAPSVDLSAVWISCDGQPYQHCEAVVGGDGKLFEGREDGQCDGGGWGGPCAWEWSEVSAVIGEAIRAIWRDDQGVVAATTAGGRWRRQDSGAWRLVETLAGTQMEGTAPVHEVQTKMWWRRERTLSGRVALGGRTLVNVGGGWNPLRDSRPFFAIATPERGRGDVALLVGADGEVAVAR